MMAPWRNCAYRPSSSANVTICERAISNSSWTCSSLRCNSFKRDLFVRLDCALRSRLNDRRHDKTGVVYVHLLRNLDALTFLFVLPIDSLLFLLDEFGLPRGDDYE